MRAIRPLAGLALAALLTSACGGGSGATQAAAATTPAGGNPTAATSNATDEPQATQTGGGGGSKPAGWDQYGSVHIEVSGPVSKSADYGFVPAGSLFGGAQGASLNFTVEGTNEVVAILISADGTVVISYGGQDFSMPAAQCTTSNWNVGATSGSGSFDCTAQLTILASGASVQGGKITGTFQAHA